jgi:hypothetical protein
MPNGGKRQAATGIASLGAVLPSGPTYMGLDVPDFIEGVRACFERTAPMPPPILLHL